MQPVLNDLAAEQEALDQLVTGLSEETWDTVTPAEPWTVTDQISHLAFFDEQAALSARDPDAFATELNRALAEGVETYMATHLEQGRVMAPNELLAWWRAARRDLIAAFTACDPEERLPWFGPPMRAESSATARLMETWAHGHDIADALGVRRLPTDRLFRVAELGVRTLSWSFSNRGLDVPKRRVRVVLLGPSGTERTWNPDEEDSIRGDVEEFCLVVAQRRHFDDTALEISGDLARRWMEVAQVFAGPPGPGRPPSSPKH